MVSALGELRIMTSNFKKENFENESKSLSDADSNDSLGFLDTEMMNENVFGPNIPEDDKPTVTRVMEKMASLWEQKKNNRVRVIQHWRLMRMTEKIKLLKHHNQAYLKLLKLSRKPFSAFYKIR